MRIGIFFIFKKKFLAISFFCFFTALVFLLVFLMKGTLKQQISSLLAEKNCQQQKKCHLRKNFLQIS